MSERRNMRGNYRDIDYYLRILSKYNVSPDMISQMTDKELLRYPGIGIYGVSLLRGKFGFDYTRLNYEDRLKYELEKALIPILIRCRNVGKKKLRFIIEFIHFLIKNSNII
jgi:hypothetical protein